MDLISTDAADVEDLGRETVGRRADGLVDGFGRAVRYLRVSVTDRCDLRCAYCMDENMQFLPRQELLSLEELDRVCSAFIGRGVEKIRITGGEPLVRRNVMGLFESLARHLRSGRLRELTLTTNGTQLERFAAELARCGVRRVNVSLDTLDPAKFGRITRWGDFAKVLRGIDAARQNGLAVKINAVALKGLNDEEVPDLVAWSHAGGMDITFIEVMPLGERGEGADRYLPLDEVRRRLASHFTLRSSAHATGGPARYFDCEETGRRVGFITPLSHNFCESCNRVRLTCTGKLYMCLGQNGSADLRAALRADDSGWGLDRAIADAIARKARGHDFVADRLTGSPTVRRTMSVTGG